jgi:uncharacterized membrane protein YgdD (TMEM256/DUF423 family)
VGFDISQSTGIAYLSLDNLPSSSADSEFYTVNLSTGAATFAGSIPVSLLDFSLAVGLPVPEPAGFALMLAGLGVLGFAMRRRRSPEA